MQQNIETRLQCHDLKFQRLNGIEIIQPPNEQSHDGCAFAAVAKQLDIQLRMIYAKGSPPTSLHEGICLFDHKLWEAKIRQKYKSTRDVRSRWRLEELLAEAKLDGLPLWNGSVHMIQHSVSAYIDLRNDRLVAMKSFLDFSPCIGVIRVKTDFKVNGDAIYLGIGDEKDDEYVNEFGKKIKKKAHHAVVCLDYMEIDGVVYICYQNQSGNPDKSLCKKGISWMISDVLVELHYGASLPPVHPSAILQSKNQVLSVLHELKSIREVINVVNNNQAPGKKLLKGAASHIEKAEWKDAKETIVKIEKVIEKAKASCHILQKFNKKYGRVGKAGAVASTHVEEVIEAYRNSLEFHDTLINFCSVNDKVVTQSLSTNAEIVPGTLEKQIKPTAGSLMGAALGRRGGSLFEGDRPRFGDREGYRAGPRGPGDFGDRGGAPTDCRPSSGGPSGRSGGGH